MNVIDRHSLNRALHAAGVRIQAWHLDKITRQDAIAIATDAAFQHGRHHAYVTEPFEPHEWVIEAVLSARNGVTSNDGRWDTLTPPEGRGPEFGCEPHLYRPHPDDMAASVSNATLEADLRFLAQGNMSAPGADGARFGAVAHVRAVIDNLQRRLAALESAAFTAPVWIGFDMAAGAEKPDVPHSCDGKEQDAFEAWAISQHYDMRQHPLHYLFLNELTYHARQGWKAGLEYAVSRVMADARSTEPASDPVSDPPARKDSTTYAVRMAKATSEDVDAAIKIASAIEGLHKGYSPFEDEELPPHFDPDDSEHLRRLYDFLIEATEGVGGGLSRVAGGMHTILFNDILDPDDDCIALHPRLKVTPVPAWLAAVKQELESATTKFPTWSTDPLHAVAVVGEEAGELTKAVLQVVYEPHKSTIDDVRTEAIQTAAMAIRFVNSLDRYVFRRGPQHEQALANG